MRKSKLLPPLQPYRSIQYNDILPSSSMASVALSSRLSTRNGIDETFCQVHSQPGHKHAPEKLIRIRCSVLGVCASAHSKIPDVRLSLLSDPKASTSALSLNSSHTSLDPTIGDSNPLQISDTNRRDGFSRGKWGYTLHTSLRANVDLWGPLVDPRYQFPTKSPVLPRA